MLRASIKKEFNQTQRPVFFINFYNSIHVNLKVD